MINILMYVSTGLIVISFVSYFLMIMFANKKVTKSTGFDITKDIISEYNTINVIESKNYFTIYNIKRKVIKLSTKCYYGNSLADISLSLIEASVSVIDNKNNKYIDTFRRICNNLKILYILPLVSLIINHFTYTISDAKVSLIFVILFGIISYILIDIKNLAFVWIYNNLNKIKDISEENVEKIINFINRMLCLDKLIFFGELTMCLRFMLILFNVY